MTTQLRTTLGLLLAATAAQAQVPTANAPNIPAGSYTATCNSARVVGNTLMANCRRADQSSNATSITVPCPSGKIENNNGVLTCLGGSTPPSGSYASSCTGAVVAPGNVLKANCRGTFGVIIPATLQLPCHGQIHNINMSGRLACMSSPPPQPAPAPGTPPVSPAAPAPGTPPASAATPPPKPAIIHVTLPPRTNGNVFNLELSPTGSKDKCWPEQHCRFVLKPGSKIEAEGLPGYVFDKWGGTCSGQATPICVVEKAGDAIASFKVATFPLSVRIQQSGTVRITSGSQVRECRRGEKCEIRVQAGTTLEAVPEKGWAFQRWSGLCTSSRTTCTVSKAGMVDAFFGTAPK